MTCLATLRTQLVLPFNMLSPKNAWGARPIAYRYHILFHLSPHYASTTFPFHQIYTTLQPTTATPHPTIRVLGPANRPFLPNLSNPSLLLPLLPKIRPSSAVSPHYTTITFPSYQLPFHQFFFKLQHSPPSHLYLVIWAAGPETMSTLLSLLTLVYRFHPTQKFDFQ